MVGNSRRIPNYVRGRSPEGLRRAMLQNNLKRGMEYNYQIVHDGKEWFAWYREEVASAELLMNELPKAKPTK